MSEVLIKVENVSKKFCKDLKRSLWYGMTDIARSVMGGAPPENLREGEFWAVRDVSFEVRRGECLGLIGHNGAGKSTLLKMLNGLINPDEGRIEMHGKIGALIELGAGFNPILTGRENVYNNGAVLGFSKAEIDRKFDDIVAFAEIEDFIDMPVQNYSSGMKVRLGFAIASQMEPDILIIDEVLAVGDAAFRAKCINQIMANLDKMAVIFVSHSMIQVGRICNLIVLLDHGIIKVNGNEVFKGIEAYQTANFKDDSHTTETFVDKNYSGIRDIEIDFVDKETGQCVTDLVWEKRYNLKVRYSSTINVKNCNLFLIFDNNELIPAASYYIESFDIDDRKDTFYNTSIALNLSSSVYSVRLICANNKNNVIFRKISKNYISVKEIGMLNPAVTHNLLPKEKL